MNEQEHQKLRLYEERLVANKIRRQTGEVAIGKRVETETARVSVPVEKERVVIERRTPEALGLRLLLVNMTSGKAKWFT
jgi:stress response protein YsnF